MGMFISLLTSPTAQGNAQSRLFLHSLRASIKFCLACKQPDSGGRFLSPCLVQLTGEASDLL